MTADHETGHLTGPGSDPEYKPLVNNGQGKVPGCEWHSGGHTNALVPFARGAGGERFVLRATKQDPVRGAYLDNTDLAGVVFELMR